MVAINLIEFVFIYSVAFSIRFPFRILIEEREVNKATIHLNLS